MTGAVLAALIAVPAGFLVPAQGWSQAIEEIVVTARKKTESLQHVPLSISAFSADMIRERNIQNVYDVAKHTPNIVFDFPLFDRSAGPSYGPGRVSGNANQQGNPLQNQDRNNTNSQAFVLTPRRGTNYGVTLQWRFGQ